MFTKLKNWLKPSREVLELDRLFKQLTTNGIKAEAITADTPKYKTDPDYVRILEEQLEKYEHIARSEAYRIYMEHRDHMYWKAVVDQFLAGKCPQMTLGETYKFHQVLADLHPEKFDIYVGPPSSNGKLYHIWKTAPLSYIVDHGDGYFTKNTYIPNQTSLMMEEYPTHD